MKTRPNLGAIRIFALFGFLFTIISAAAAARAEVSLFRDDFPLSLNLVQITVVGFLWTLLLFFIGVFLFWNRLSGDRRMEKSRLFVLFVLLAVFAGGVVTLGMIDGKGEIEIG